MKKTIKKLKKYTVEIIILTIAFLIAVSSLVIFLANRQQTNEEQIITSTSPTNQKTSIIFADVSGSVNKPGLYEASSGSRLNDFIKKAGGLSDEADKNFFARNFNLARIVVDQEKIYVPSIWEVNNGYFIENPQTVNYLLSTNNQPPITNNQSSTSDYQSLININQATIEELDTLPGIGKTTAKKIIDNRPFEALEELINKKIVNKSTYENIKNLITF